MRFTRRQALSGSAIAATLAAVATVPVVERVTTGVPDEAESTASGLQGAPVMDQGLVGDGETDNTDAINALLQQHDVVRLPSGRFKVAGTIKVPRYKHLAGTRSASYTGVPELGSVLVGDRGEGPVIALDEGAALSQLSIVGTPDAENATRDGVLAGGRNVIDNVTVTATRNGINCEYSGVNKIIGCHIHGNFQHGIVNPVDSIISQNYINVNRENGIQFSVGANDNIISQNKIEWNHGCGLALEATKHNIIAINNVDRNGRSGIRAEESSQTTIIGNILRRNGARSTSDAEGSNHLLIRAGTASIVIGNATETGPDDDGSGYESPRHSVVLLGQAKGMAVANDLSGALDTTNAVHGEGSGDFLIGPSHYRDSSRGNTPLRGHERIDLPAESQPVTIDFDANEVKNFDVGVAYSLRIMARNPRNAERSLANALLVVTRESGKATVAVENLTNFKGKLFGNGETNSGISVTCEVAGNGSKISVILLNRDSIDYQTRVTLSEA